MAVSTRSTPHILLLLCSSTAILMTLLGMLFLLSSHLLSVLSRGEKFMGETDAISIALIFGGIAVALKTIEIRIRADRDSSID